MLRTKVTKSSRCIVFAYILAPLMCVGVANLPVTEVTSGFSQERKDEGALRTVLADTSLFGAVVGWIKAGGFITSQEVTHYPLRVDPRPLRADAGKPGGAVYRSFGKNEFAEVNVSILKRRKAILQHLEVPQRNALSYYDECLGTGAPRPIKREEVEHTQIGPPDRCKFTVVALSLPYEDSIPTPEIEKGKQAFHRETRVFRTVKVFRQAPSFFIVYGLNVERTDGSWKVVRNERIDFLMW